MDMGMQMKMGMGMIIYTRVVLDLNRHTRDQCGHVQIRT
jgi:hypothetical protein